MAAKVMSNVSGQMSLFQCICSVLEPIKNECGERVMQSPQENVACNAAVSEEVKKKIRVCGKGAAKIKATEDVLFSLPLTGKEGSDRLLIQKALDEHSGMASVLYDGNTVYASKKLVKELKKMAQTGSLEKMTDAMYQFLSLNFDIAHYNKRGFIDYYDGLWGKFLMETLSYSIHRIPGWETDVRKIVMDAGLLD